MARKKMCQKCQTPWTLEGLVPFDASCDRCGSPLHICLNCALHDPLNARGCEYRKGDPSIKPAAKNFCESFIFRESYEPEFQETSLERKDAQRKWNELFRD